jgi:hypothetical protein
MEYALIGACLHRRDHRLDITGPTDIDGMLAKLLPAFQ